MCCVYASTIIKKTVSREAFDAIIIVCYFATAVARQWPLAIHGVPTVSM
jgi:hypothetical protein